MNFGFYTTFERLNINDKFEWNGNLYIKIENKDSNNSMKILDNSLCYIITNYPVLKVEV